VNTKRKIHNSGYNERFVVYPNDLDMSELGESL